jgi:parallel beta-helix repeat protein
MSYRLIWARYCLVLFLVSLFCFSSTVAFAAVFYVDVNSLNPLKDGNIDSPFDSIQLAIDASSSGDVIQVAAGVYVGDLSIDGKGISLVGESPLTTILSGFSTVIDVFGTYSPGGEVLVSGFSIKDGATSGIDLQSATLNAIVKNCIINSNAYGIRVYTTGNNVKINNNTIANNSANGIWADAYSNNPIIAIYNNIIIGNTLQGSFTPDASVSCYYNNAWSNGLTDLVSCDTVLGNISDAPNFINEEIGDFRLASISTSIDAGSPTLSDADPDGSRNNLGAFGGPGAADFWPGTAGGPVVTDLIILTPSIPSGGTLAFQATGEIK